MSEKCCLEGIVYLGSRTWTRFWNPEFCTTLNGHRSSTTNRRIAPEIAFTLPEFCGSLAANNVKSACWPEWVVFFIETVVSEHSEDVDCRHMLRFLRAWSVRFVVFLLYFNIIRPGHKLHATLVLSTRLFSFSLWPSMCSVQQVVSWSMSTKNLCVLSRFLHVTYLYRVNITYYILILIWKRICVHFHVMRAESPANIVVDITANFFLLICYFWHHHSLLLYQSLGILFCNRFVVSLAFCFLWSFEKQPLLSLGRMGRLCNIYWCFQLRMRWRVMQCKSGEWP